MTILEVKQALDETKGRAQFVSVIYTAKKHGEKARYTMLLNSNYRKLCEADILELELRLPESTGIEQVVISGLIESLKESIRAMDEGRDHVLYTKPGQYVPIVKGLKVNLRDMTCEIQGLVQRRHVLIPGDYKERKMSPQVAVKESIRKTLKIGKWRTLAVDVGNLHSIKLRGRTLVFS